MQPAGLRQSKVFSLYPTRIRSPLSWTAISLLCSLLSAPIASAMDADSYLEALKYADQFVQRKKQSSQSVGHSQSVARLLRARSGVTPLAPITGLSQSLLRGRPTQVGDSWWVAAYREVPNQLRLQPEDPSLPLRASVGVFRYEVTAVEPAAVAGGAPQITIKVTQHSAYGAPILDQKIQAITLRTNDRFVSLAKSYVKADGRSEVAVSPNGLRSKKVSRLELFPLDVPELPGAIPLEDATPSAGTRPDLLDNLPDLLKSVARKAGYEANPADGVWLDQTDLFGRPLQILWQPGKPWPTYIKSEQGIALLLPQGES